jgi:hypothetical protein
MAVPKGGDYADVEAGSGLGDEVCVSLKGGWGSWAVPSLTWYMNRTGAPPQRGSIVNISSVLGRVGNATNGSVSPQNDRPFGFSI